MEITKKTVLSIQNLEKNYGKEQVLKNFNFVLREGDSVALLGLNGSGKTTLIEIILGFQNFQKGKVIYENGAQNFFQGVLSIFQIGKYPGDMKVKNLISFCKNFYNTKCVDQNKIDQLINFLELNKYLNNKINKLSFGQKKKVEALITLMINGKTYIIDELTAGVDINARINIVKIFTKIFNEKKDKSMIWITHDHNEIENLCNRVVILSKKEKGIVFDKNLEAAKKEFGSIKKMLEKFVKEETEDKKNEFEKFYFDEKKKE